MADAVAHKAFSSTGILKLTQAFCLGAMITIIGTDASNAKEASSGTPISPQQTSTPHITPPWGELQVTSIPFENSEELFLDRAERLKKPEWVFEPATPDQVEQLLKSSDLNEAQKHELLATNTWTVQPSNCTIHPSQELLGSLSAIQREKLYGALAQCQSNYAQCFPFRFPPNRFEERFENSGLSAERIQSVRDLCYTNDGLLSFCDLGVAATKFKPQEFDALIRVLYSFPTVRLRLRVRPDSNIDQLAAYWGKGGREKRIRPILESLARLPGGDSVSIAYLLPGTARLRLYTFPDIARDPREAREDCFFTALNFFNKYSDDRFFDKANSREVIQTQYSLVQGAPTYGDLITLIDSHGDAVHIAVYIAEDIVFTKNGVNMLQPWVLMRMDDMMSYFPSSEPVRIAIFRKKDLPQRSATAR